MFSKISIVRQILSVISHQQDLSNNRYLKILEQADRIVSRVDWTKEERKMFDERTSYIQAYLGHLATVEKEKKDAKM